MKKAIVTPKKSLPFCELEDLFLELKKPYGHADIVRFNLLYMRIYKQLERDERRQAETFVDALIEGVEKEELRSKIFGVV
ncbi:MAG TPA: hypothetical protein VLU73_00155 [Methylococcaceae bacterium]|jgi:hypothetical protein|nr:hypothetical protein [Methylococcaceae bacterium]